jgi:DNA-binding IclR family transcriptional regulator
MSDAIRSLETGVGVFKALHALGRSAGLREIAGLVHMHPSKLHRYLATLVMTGLVEQDADRRYASGPYARALANGEAGLAQVRANAERALPGLAREVGQTVLLSVWGRTGPLIVTIEEAPVAVTVRPAVSGDLPQTRSSAGRVFAAFLPAESMRPLVKAELKGKGAEGLAVYERQLQEVRRRKAARSLGERYPGINAISVPILGADGHAMLAVTAFGMRETFPASWDGSVAKTLSAWARARSANATE